jgi:hypothetical protein
MTGRPVLISLQVWARVGGALLICYGATLVYGSLASQQTSGPTQTPIIRAQSSLVLVDVIGQDPKNGLPVRDFQKEDFRVFDNRQAVPIASFDAGTASGTRPVVVWLVVICNEQGKIGGSANYARKEALFRPALDHLDEHDTVGVAHWCDNGETQLDLAPTENRDTPIRVLAGVIRPIPFRAGNGHTDEVGEVTFRKMIRLIIQDAQRRNPRPLPAIVFLDGDHTGQPIQELNELVDDFLETSGIVFGIKDSGYPVVLPLMGEHAQILHYMAKHTGGQYMIASPSGYAAALESILMQLHFRYEIGFIPPAIDGKRHALKVELTHEAREKHKGVRLRFRPEYIPVSEEPAWAR